MGATKPGEQGTVSDAVAHRVESVRGPKGVRGGGADYSTAHGRELTLVISRLGIAPPANRPVFFSCM